jgi:hypothetical protein
VASVGPAVTPTISPTAIMVAPTIQVAPDTGPKVVYAPPATSNQAPPGQPQQ